MVLDGELASFSIQNNEGVIHYQDGRLTFSGADWKSKRSPVKRMRVRAELKDGVVLSVRPLEVVWADAQFSHPLDFRRNAASQTDHRERRVDETDKVFLHILRDIVITILGGAIIVSVLFMALADQA